MEKISLNYRHFASWPGAMINPQWLEQPLFWANFHGPKAVWATEFQLYIEYSTVHQVFFICVYNITVNNLSVMLW